MLSCRPHSPAPSRFISSTAPPPPARRGSKSIQILLHFPSHTESKLKGSRMLLPPLTTRRPPSQPPACHSGMRPASPVIAPLPRSQPPSPVFTLLVRRTQLFVGPRPPPPNPPGCRRRQIPKAWQFRLTASPRSLRELTALAPDDMHRASRRTRQERRKRDKWLTEN